VLHVNVDVTASSCLARATRHDQFLSRVAIARFQLASCAHTKTSVKKRLGTIIPKVVERRNMVSPFEQQCIGHESEGGDDRVWCVCK
jgi:hypothetical protein